MSLFGELALFVFEVTMEQSDLQLFHYWIFLLLIVLCIWMITLSFFSFDGLLALLVPLFSRKYFLQCSVYKWVVMDPFSLLISWQCFLSPSPMADSFAGVGSPGCWTLLQVLQAFQISMDKLAVILIGFPFFVTCGVCCFTSLAVFNTFFVLFIWCFDHDML